MTSFSHSPRDRVLWTLANNGGAMERSRLRATTGMRYAILVPILNELVREGRIKIASGKDGGFSILSKVLTRAYSPRVHDRSYPKIPRIWRGVPVADSCKTTRRIVKNEFAPEIRYMGALNGERARVKARDIIPA